MSTTCHSQENGWTTTTRSTLRSRSLKAVRPQFLLAVHGHSHKSHAVKTTIWCLKLDKIFPDTICGQAGGTYKTTWTHHFTTVLLGKTKRRLHQSRWVLPKKGAYVVPICKSLMNRILSYVQSFVFVFKSCVQKKHLKSSFFLRTKYL